MKKPAFWLYSLLGILFLSGCASRTTILKVGEVSMSYYSEGRYFDSLKEVGWLEVSYCEGFKTYTAKRGKAGMMDEVIYRAQKRTRASFLKKVVFSMEDGCMILEGIAYRRVKSNKNKNKKKLVGKKRSRKTARR